MNRPSTEASDAVTSSVPVAALQDRVEEPKTPVGEKLKRAWKSFGPLKAFLGTWIIAGVLTGVGVPAAIVGGFSAVGHGVALWKLIME